jgi:Xaa-Pro dipeptidase
MLEAMVQQQGEFPASLPYAYFGSRSWRRMQQPDVVALSAGEPFYLECGGSSSRYAAATLRSGYFGECPAEYRDLYAAALDCFLALERSLKPGVISAELDTIGSEIIGNAGFSELRLSKFGYSIGVAFSPGWGEAGAFDIDPHSQAPVAENMVIHLVSTLMSPKWGTVGLSETVEVTADGCVSLTPSERGLIALN